MECPICLSPLNNCPEGVEDNVRRRLTKIKSATCCCTPCGHIFHKACLLTWLDQNTRPPCPVCNEKLTKMKLYPAYLNVDKESSGATNASSGGGAVDGRQPAVGQQVVTSSLWTGGGGGNRTVSTTATATVTLPMGPPAVICSRPGCNHQGASGLSMTIGTYALTTFGHHPLVAAAAVGAPLGTTIPRAHPQLLGNVGLGNSSAFVAFPQTSLTTVPMTIAMPILSTTTTISSGRGGGAGRASGDGAGMEAGTNGASAENTALPGEAQLQTRRGAGGSSSRAILGGASFPPVAQSRTICQCEFCRSVYAGGNGMGSSGSVGGSNHYRIGGGGARYCPYPQPPPAHAATSLSLPRRITNIIENASRVANNSAAVGIGGENGDRGTGGRQAAPPRMHVHSPPNVHEYRIQSEP